MTLTSFQPPKRLLMGPGPSDVHDRVLAAMGRTTIGHLDPEFIRLMDQIKAHLRAVFLTDNDLTMPISGPATAGQEATIVNLLEPGDKVVVCVNGVFGGRLAEMARRAGAEVTTVDQDWGRAVDPEALRAELKRVGPVKLVAFVHAETSTGALSDGETLAKIAHEAGAMVLMDTVTSLAGVPVRIDDWGIDACYSGTQKCLSCPPGLSPVTFSKRAQDVMNERQAPVQSWFLDLSLLTGYWSGGAQRAYHHTAPVNALYGLHESLVMILEEGLESVWARHRRCHEGLVAGLEAMGLTMAVPAAERVPELNAVRVPEGVDEAGVRRRLLEDHGIEIGAGLGPLAGKIWRIGLMGQSSRPENVARCLAALETVLQQSGYQVRPGEATAAAEAVAG
ncbi:alanine--glyoxylate aminotransferase family protein [Salinisphaera sp. P385]|uniref:Alanine--glyoxylate aminotransferase family protein n=1 Tax=Spectribacter acetivorans TaxID=3075603 RepID=A0ABU3BBX7_9GAMM|nr:alanine--glyoxylate aminotransferase family protein [Salinisphaera sp. P385]MDT0619322.1 alanine--glyoxylate aminotransferase family protein [Salinisphaera sp. P385]